MVASGPVPVGKLLTTVGVLTFSSAIIAQFVAQGIPLFLREAGVPGSLIGLVYIAAIPYTLKFLWAPLVDRYSLGSRGRFAGWIAATQAIAVLGLILLSTLSPGGAPIPIILVVTLLMFALGTQQTAIGGLMVEGLPSKAFPRGSALQAGMAGLAGVFLGLAVLYLLGDLGWRAVLLPLVAIATLVLMACRLVLVLDHGRPIAAARPRFWTQLALFRRSEARHLLVLTVLANSAIVLPYAMKSVLLIDAGYSVSNAALIGVVFGSLFGVVGALAARRVVERLGSLSVISGLAVVNAGVAAIMAWRARDGMQAGEVVALVLFANASVFAGFTAVRARAMQLCGKGREATDLAAFTGVDAIVFLMIAGAGVAALDTVGATPLFALGAVLSLIGAVYSFNAHREMQVT